MRYWNMARQRYCCGLARCWRALRLSADRAENAARKRALFGALIEESGSHMTRRWRRESRANPSLKWGSRAWQYGTIPRGLWMITEAEKGYFGLENGGISVFALGSFS